MILDDAFYANAASKSRVMPFVVASHAESQDRLIVGPAAFADNQSELLNWLYRDLGGADRQPIFRMGRLLGLSVATRVFPLDLEESISRRRDAVVSIGLASANGSAGRLCECLGLLVRQLTGIVASGGYGSLNASEDEMMAALAVAVAQSAVGFDWGERALLALRECELIPRFRVVASLRERLIRSRKMFAVLIDDEASTPLEYRVASEFWRRNRSGDLSIVLQRHQSELGVSRIVYDAGFQAPSALAMLEGGKVRIGRYKLRAFF